MQMLIIKNKILIEILIKTTSVVGYEEVFQFLTNSLRFEKLFGTKNSASRQRGL